MNNNNNKLFSVKPSIMSVTKEVKKMGINTICVPKIIRVVKTVKSKYDAFNDYQLIIIKSLYLTHLEYKQNRSLYRQYKICCLINCSGTCIPTIIHFDNQSSII